MVNCYECQHRRNIPGDAHSSCAHPKVKPLLSDPIGGLLTILGGVDISEQVSYPKVMLNPHGVRMGWASWPFNFDPVWVESCDAKELIHD